MGKMFYLYSGISVLWFLVLCFLPVSGKNNAVFVYENFYGKDVYVGQTTDKTKWMQAVDDTVPICKLSIPGTHDSGAMFGGEMLQTQGEDLRGQLQKGIRAFDIRLKAVNGKLGVFHSFAFQNIYWEDDVLPLFIDFLTQNPSETLIVSLKKEGGEIGDYASLLAKSLRNVLYSDFFVTEFNPQMSLGDCRGKILFLHRDHVMDDFPGASCHGWDDNATCLLSLQGNDGTTGYAFLQDEYQYKNGWEAFKKIFACVRNFDTICAEPLSSFRWGISYVSATGLPTGTPVVFANQINKSLVVYLSENKRKSCGIVFIDFVDTTDGKRLVDYLIESNM